MSEHIQGWADYRSASRRGAAYKLGWADYRSALYLSDEEVLHITTTAQDEGQEFYDAWCQGWADATEADDTLMD
jgi:hypothetical protein